MAVVSADARALADELGRELAPLETRIRDAPRFGCSCVGDLRSILALS
jgi:hypothetical protein